MLAKLAKVNILYDLFYEPFRSVRKLVASSLINSLVFFFSKATNDDPEKDIKIWHLVHAPNA